jgi:hypothetical protein
MVEFSKVLTRTVRTRYSEQKIPSSTNCAIVLGLVLGSDIPLLQVQRHSDLADMSQSNEGDLFDFELESAWLSGSSFSVRVKILDTLRPREVFSIDEPLIPSEGLRQDEDLRFDFGAVDRDVVICLPWSGSNTKRLESETVPYRRFKSALRFDTSDSRATTNP